MPSRGSGWNWSGGGASAPAWTRNPTSSRNSYTSGWFALEMDNQAVPVGFVTQIDGGLFKSTVLESHAGDTPYVPKYAGKPSYEDITIGIGMPNSARLFQWVQSAIANSPERHTGAIVGFDNFQSRYERSRRVFDQALINEISFPTLDATSHAPANITLKIAPETLTYQKGSSVFSAQQARDEDVKQKRWSCANFGFRLDGFWGTGVQRNIHLQGFTIKQTIMPHDQGSSLTTFREPGRIEYPNLVLTFNEENLQGWYDWWQDSVVGGNITRRTGAISWYSPDLQTELMRLELDGVGILNLEVAPYNAGHEQIAKAKVTLYVESMALVAGAGNV